MMKKLLSLISALSMLLSMLVLPTAAEPATNAGASSTGILPAYTGTNTAITFTDVYKCELMTVKGTDRAAFEAYLEVLAANGFARVIGTETRAVLGTENFSAMFQKTAEGTTWLVNAFFDAVDSVARITVEDARGADLSAFDPASATAGSCEPILIQVGLGPVRNNGMAYIYRLSDGRFVIYDGGGESFGTSEWDIKHAAYLYNTMEKYNKVENGGAGGEIKVAAWLITHPHVDHMGGFMAFTYFYMNNDNYDVEVENVICYLPNPETTSTTKKTDYAVSTSKVARYDARLDILRADGTNVYKAHPGQMYYFGDMTVEILFTYDLLTGDLYISNETGNDLSNTYSIISQATLNGHKAVWVGDSTGYSLVKLNSLYGPAMKSTFAQIPHHGWEQLITLEHRYALDLFYGDVTLKSDLPENAYFPELYPETGEHGYVRPKYVFYPTVDVSANSGHLADSHEGVAGNHASEHLVWETAKQGGGVYVADSDLTVFSLGGATVEAPTIDGTVITDTMPMPEITSTTVRSQAELKGANIAGDIVLGDDITVEIDSAADLPLIGDYGANFSGTLDGGGYTITVKAPADLEMDTNVGVLFTFIKGNENTVEIKNLNIVVEPTLKSVGGTGCQQGVIASRIDSGTVNIDNVNISVNYSIEASTNRNIGGMIGDVRANVNVKNCNMNITAKQPGSAANALGGLFGRINDKNTTAVNIENVAVYADMVTKQNLGGLVALSNKASAVINVKNTTVTGRVKGGTAGEFFASNAASANTTMTDCKATVLASKPTEVRKGMRVRVDGTGLGLAFDITVDAASIEAMQAIGYEVELGALIAPKSTVTEAGNKFTHAALEGKTFTDVSVTDADLSKGYYTAHRAASSAEEYRTEFVCVGYLRLVKRDGEGKEISSEYLYSAYVPNGARTMRYVAGAALADADNGLTEAELAILQEYRK